MEQTNLFPEVSERPERKSPEATRPQDARVVRPVRNQIQFLMQDLDATLAEEHQARIIWAFLDRQELSAFYASIQAVEGGPGRPASDPQVLLAIWVHATANRTNASARVNRMFLRCLMVHLRKRAGEDSTPCPG